MKKTQSVETYLKEKGWESMKGGETKVWEHKDSVGNIITKPLMTSAEELQNLMVLSTLEKRDVWDILEDIITISQTKKEEEEKKAQAIKKVDLTNVKKAALENLQKEVAEVKEMSDTLFSLLQEGNVNEVFSKLVSFKNKVEKISESDAQKLTKQAEIIINEHDGVYKEAENESFAYYQTLGFDMCIVLSEEVFLLTKNISLTFEQAKEFFELYAKEEKEECSIFFNGHDVLVTPDYNF